MFKVEQLKWREMKKAKTKHQGNVRFLKRLDAGIMARVGGSKKKMTKALNQSEWL